MEQHQDLSMLAFRLDSLEKRLEKDVERLNMQLSNYVPVRENELKLQSIQDIVKRIEAEITDSKQQMIDISEKLDKQRESQDKLQIRMLYAVVTTVITVLSGVLIGYITHFF
jgi:hypothetical protein